VVRAVTPLEDPAEPVAILCGIDDLTAGALTEEAEGDQDQDGKASDVQEGLCKCGAEVLPCLPVCIVCAEAADKRFGLDGLNGMDAEREAAARLVLAAGSIGEVVIF